MSTLTTDTLTGTYTPDPTHSRIGFVARHAMVTKVRGQFTEYTGSGHFDAEHPENSTIELTINAGSIDTGNDDRDAHLRSNDFFDMDNHPTITFRSTRIQPVQPDVYRVTGHLTVRGTTKPVTIDFEYAGSAVDPYGNTRIGLEGSTEVSRKDFGLNWNTALDTGGVLVSDKVTLEFDVSAIRA
jgi:polyisoprenoid-binding protein YceI